MLIGIKKLRSRGGYTLAELLAVLALLAIFSTAVVVGITASAKVSKESVRESHFSVVSDTVNSAIRDILVNSVYEGISENGEVLFTCEKYSGRPMSLGVQNGRLAAIIHDGGLESSELLLNTSSYAEFEAAEFEMAFSDGIYICRYTLVCDDFQREVTFNISPINQSSPLLSGELF